jgi:gamma-glutamyltranspeptidase/glutathione hydrolase
VHDLVEGTKQAFRVRDAHVCDPACMTVDPSTLLIESEIGKLARRIDRNRAAPWSHSSAPGDTIWMGAIDGDGRAVSFIQSLYWEFGSGVVSPSTGILMWTAPGLQGGAAWMCRSGRLRSYVRPVDAVGSTAGPDGIRGSGPKH